MCGGNTVPALASPASELDRTLGSIGLQVNQVLGGVSNLFSTTQQAVKSGAGLFETIMKFDPTNGQVTTQKVPANKKTVTTKPADGGLSSATVFLGVVAVIAAIALFR